MIVANLWYWKIQDANYYLERLNYLKNVLFHFSVWYYIRDLWDDHLNWFENFAWFFLKSKLKNVVIVDNVNKLWGQYQVPFDEIWLKIN